MRNIILYSFDKDYNFIKTFKAYYKIEEVEFVDDYCILTIKEDNSLEEDYETWNSLSADLDKKINIYISTNIIPSIILEKYLLPELKKLAVGIYNSSQFALVLPTKLRYNFVKEILKEYFSDEQFCHFLECYFDCNLNVSSSSAKLYMHRNTLLYRLSNFKQKTGFDLHRFKDASLIYSCLIK